MLSNSSWQIIASGFHHVEYKNHKWFRVVLFLFVSARDASMCHNFYGNLVILNSLVESIGTVMYCMFFLLPNNTMCALDCGVFSHKDFP